VGYSVVLLALISVAGFFMIELPPGDYLTMYIEELRSRGDTSAEEQIDILRARYGLDKPVYERYWTWITNFVQGDFGRSFYYEREVKDLIGQRLALTVALTMATMIIQWAIAIPVGIYAATHQYSLGDQITSAVSFMALGTPNFLLALVVLFVASYYFNQSVGGLFSREYIDAPWSVGKVVDLLKHLWLPAVIIGLSGTAGLIRIMRSNLLEVMRKPFVLAARAKGLPERRVIIKHAVRMAINPLVSILGMSLPNIISGAALTAIVLNLPTTGPMFTQALQHQDMYLAGTFLVFLSAMLVLGNLLSDVALAWVDPRIRYD